MRALADSPAVWMLSKMLSARPIHGNLHVPTERATSPTFLQMRWPGVWPACTVCGRARRRKRIVGSQTPSTPAIGAFIRRSRPRIGKPARFRPGHNLICRNARTCGPVLRVELKLAIDERRKHLQRASARPVRDCETYLKLLINLGSWQWVHRFGGLKVRPERADSPACPEVLVHSY